MKKMKKFKYIILSLFVISALNSCIDDDNDELTGDADTGGLVTIKNESVSIGYVVGNDATYTASASVSQGVIKTNSIDIYKSFTDSQTGVVSNEVLFESKEFTSVVSGINNDFDTSFKYENLIDGLTLDGDPLPTSDVALNIGDFFTLRYAANTSTGNLNYNASKTKVSVGTRFAGTYNVIDKAYWRIGVLRDDVEWPTQMLIESVDANTYRVVEYFGAFSGNEYYFQIDANDRITYPAETPSGDAQTGNGQPITTCELNASDLANVPCGAVSNYDERDDLGGKDKLFMTFGYFTDGSGAREFYQVLEKNI